MAGFLVAACSRPKGSASSAASTVSPVTAGPVTAAPVTAAPSTDLRLFAWSEYVPATVLDGFTRETGIRVHYETFASNEEMLAKLVAGGGAYDLIQPSDYTVELLARKGKLTPLDPTRLPRLSNLDPRFRKLPFDPEGKWSVPYMAGTVGILTNSDRVKTPVRGYKELFRPEFKRKIVLPNDNREIVSWALRVAGLDVNDPSPAALAKVKPLLEAWLPLVKVYDSDSPKTALEGGDVDLGIVWSGEAALLLQRKPKGFAWTLPAEGTHLWVDNLCIPANALDPRAAYAFIDYVLRPEISKMISEKYPYLNPNLEARKLLPKEALENPASYPAIEGMGMFRDVGKAASDIDRLVTALKAGN